MKQSNREAAEKSRFSRGMLFLLIAGATAGADQLTKFLVRSFLELNRSVPLIDQVFHLTYIRNSGAAFSLLEGRTGLLIFLPLALMGVMGLFALAACRKGQRPHPALTAALALIAGGGIGNLADRIRWGYVVDFLDFRIWPVFNAADIGVCAGCGLMLIYILFLEGKKRHGGVGDAED